MAAGNWGLAWFMFMSSTWFCGRRLVMVVPFHVGISAATVRARSGSWELLGAAVAPCQLFLLWQEPQSAPPVTMCVKPGLGSEAKGLPTL